MNSLVFFLAESLVWIMVGMLVVGMFMGHRRLMSWALVSGSLAWWVGKFIKDFWFQPRPTGAPLLDGSFPSMHTALAFGMAYYVYLRHRSLGSGLLILAGLVAVGRVVYGVHFLLDILGGMILGVAVSWLIDNCHSE